MHGWLCLVLHAHLPYTRHPEHEKSLEEQWLFEAITETYIPLLQLLDAWQRDGLNSRLSISLTPTLCGMLQDPLLCARYQRHLEGLVDLAEKETHRTRWEPVLQRLATFYHERFASVRRYFLSIGGDLVSAFKRCQESGSIEILASAATHAVLPLLPGPESVRAQILTGCASHRACFGKDPEGVWLPECAYVQGLDEFLREAGLRWFIVDTHGLINAHPRPRFQTFAPVLTPRGVAAFGRDHESAHQVWSRDGGYPGDPRYRDFYRDIGFDLDREYVRPYHALPDHGGFTGIKYHRIASSPDGKQLYDPESAQQAARDHASHFLQSRTAQMMHAQQITGQPSVVVCPYDAELFGHWWFEGPSFLDFVVRGAQGLGDTMRLGTPGDYLKSNPRQQVATPADSSWGEGGYWRVWLNEKNEWILRDIQQADRRMRDTVSRIHSPSVLQRRALQQAARELLLAQASDWPFMIRAGTSPGYASRRVRGHLKAFNTLCTMLGSGAVKETVLRELEENSSLFPEIQFNYWGA